MSDDSKRVGGWSARVNVVSTKVRKNAVHSYKLFVDDMRPIPPGWIGARTVSEAIAVLATLPIREISLDHDIISPRSGVDLYQALCHETFKGVAYYIVQMPQSDRPRVRIHTANVGAAKSMCDILKVDFDSSYCHYDQGKYNDSTAG